MKTDRPAAAAIELVGGIITAVLGVALSLYVMRPATTPSDYVQLFGVETCAALFVGVGAYAHVVSRNSWGRILVWVGGAALVYKSASLLLNVPVGLYFKGWVGLFLLMPGVTALLTVLASLFSKIPREK
jgi:hypothetical protein